MIRNYQKYGDMVSYDITYSLLKNMSSEGRRYRVGLFCVYDCNIRILLAGISIVCRETTAEMYRVFELFISCHGRPPQSFITDEQESIASAINELKRQELFAGSHLLDPWHLLKNFRKNTKGTEKDKSQLTELVKRLMMTRKSVEYEDIMRDLSSDSALNVANRTIINRFLVKAPQSCYMELPRLFVGIHRFSCEKINDLVKTEIPFEVSIPNFFKKIPKLDH